MSPSASATTMQPPPLRIVAIVQARLGSERLPRKVLAEIGGRPALDILLTNLRTVRSLDGIILAVPERDVELAAFGRQCGVPVFAGPEQDVLARYVGAARQAAASAVVRVTADCPLLDPQLVDQVVQAYRRDPCDYAYVSGYPRGAGDAEVIATAALERAARESTLPWHREHVMTYITDHPERFTIRIEPAPDDLRRPDLRVCIDQPEDLEVVRQVFARLGQAGRPIHVRDVIRLLDSAPEIVRLNRHVRQRS